MIDPKKSVLGNAPGAEVPPALERDGDDAEDRKVELDRLAEELTQVANHRTVPR